MKNKNLLFIVAISTIFTINSKECNNINLINPFSFSDDQLIIESDLLHSFQASEAIVDNITKEANDLAKRQAEQNLWKRVSNFSENAKNSSKKNDELSTAVNRSNVIFEMLAKKCIDNNDDTERSDAKKSNDCRIYYALLTTKINNGHTIEEAKKLTAEELWLA